MLVLNVTFKCVPGKKEELLKKIQAEGIDALSRADEGNIKYDFYLPADDSDELLLVEKWEDAASLLKHSKQPHLARMAEIKEGLVIESVLEKYEA